MKDYILNVKNLKYGYTKETVFEDVSFIIEEGDFACLIGPNGAGKSTLMKLILGQLSPNSGEVLFNLGEKPYEKVGYVPQLGIGSSYDFPITVREMVSLSLNSELRGFRKYKKSHEEKILGALSQVGMEDKIESLYSKLSGGQRQRILIAKALVSSPDFLILDEPTNGIDEETRKSLFKLLNHLNKEHNITILMITHDLLDVQEYINKLYKLSDKKIERFE
ncbi:metal ABC transporter ATP-binding protein [Peptoniphilus stercorisuis]|uniref:Zinc transport system ATP-binding protein n=1 Tax=Peptoniphilus stercorisuis TaxID=1436965 RepID=A0ABS4KCY2_9FIRM|nr:ABC transporter ATP-binding protein [Peptoniphilus stercorisuis]MBP2025021.1 zinc transport system ATP-binding protein [Peptoniphilus stercorisuis]